MKLIITWAAAILLCFSCAKIPVQSIALSDALQAEGERMHKLNLMFLNRIFDAKRQTIENFIRDEYTPVVVEEFTKRVVKEFPNTDFKKEFPELMNAVTPQINKRRDSLVNALALQQEKLTEKLTADYTVFNTAAYELKTLLASAVKVDRERQVLFDRAKTLSANRLDFNSVESALDKFIHSSGSVGNNINDLNNIINRLLTSK